MENETNKTDEIVNNKADDIENKNSNQIEQDKSEEDPNEESFGIDSNLEASNVVGFGKGGIFQAVLRQVKYHEIGKKNKYMVLDFVFTDLEKIRTFTHREFIPKRDDKFAKKVDYFNKRMKHLIEAYMKYPEGGIGKFKTFEEFLEGVAKFFNTGKEGKPIFKEDINLIPIWIKLTFFNNNLGFPIFPNFIEKVRAGKETTLYIDKKFDSIEQAESKSGSTGSGVIASTDDLSIEEDLF